MPALSGSWRRSLRPLFALLCLLAAAAAAAQGGDATIGYLEGRIVDIVERDGARVALVRMAGGEVLEAQLPASGLFDTAALPEYRVGERVELYFAPAPGGGPREFTVSDWVRRPALLWLTGLFLVVSVAVARFKGLRAFVATGTSLAIVVLFIVPRILDGWSPVLVSLLGIGGILVLAIYFVHGLNWSTTAALVGTFIAVLITMGLGIAFTEAAKLTGFGTDDAIMLSVSAPQVALKGLLLAGMLIGALGALTDITIVQAAVVRELAHLDPHLGLGELYRRGMNVGLDHIGSLVNTLVLAYTGAGLSLLLLTVSDIGVARALNLELVAAEVVHTLVGSIGLILAVPATTVLAALLFRGDRLPLRAGELDHGHHHH